MKKLICILFGHDWGSWYFRRDQLKTRYRVTEYRIFRLCYCCRIEEETTVYDP